METTIFVKIDDFIKYLISNTDKKELLDYYIYLRKYYHEFQCPADVYDAELVMDFVDMIRDKYSSDPNNKTYRYYENLFNQNSYFMCPRYLTKESFIESFGAPTGKQTFLRKKRTLMAWFEYLVEHGRLSQEKYNELNSICFEDFDDVSIYFTNFKELHDKMENTRFTSPDPIVKICFYLIWSGLDYHDLVEVEKENIDFDKNTIVVNGKIFHINKMISDYIKESITKDYYIKDYRRIYYKDSKYLIRSKSAEKATYASLRTKLGKSNKEIKYAEVRTSGIYYRCMLYELENGYIDLDDEAVYKDILGKDKPLDYNQMHFFREDYGKFKKFVKTIK